MVPVEAGDVDGRVLGRVDGRQIGVGVQQCLNDQERAGRVFGSAGNVKRRVAVLKEQTKFKIFLKI